MIVRSQGANMLEIYEGNYVYTLAFFPDGEHLVSGGNSKRIRKRRIQDGQEVQVGTPMTTSSRINALAVSEDGKWIVVGEHGNGAAVWDATTYQSTIQLSSLTYVYGVDISPDSTRFATASHDGTASIWSITTGQELLGPLPHGTTVISVKYSPQGDRIATMTVHSVRVYDSDNGQLFCDIAWDGNTNILSKGVAWSSHCQLFAVCKDKIQCLDGSSGALLSEWAGTGTVSSVSSNVSIALSRTGKFIVCSQDRRISFWDTLSHKKIGPTFEHGDDVFSTTLSPMDTSLASGGTDKKITLRDLRGFLPWSYFTLDIPFLRVSRALFESFMQQDWTKAEVVLAEEMSYSPMGPGHNELANRALLRARLQRWSVAYDDAEASLRIHLTAIGHVAKAVCLVGKGDKEAAVRELDLTFRDCDPNMHDWKLLLLLKAMILFEAGKCDDAILRVHDLTETAKNNEMYYYLQVLGSMYLKQDDYTRAMESLERAQNIAPSQSSPHLMTISFIFGWSFDGPEIVAQKHSCEALYYTGRTLEAAEALVKMMGTLDGKARASKTLNDWISDLSQRCTEKLVTFGDEALNAKKYDEAISQYTLALSLKAPFRVALLVKRSGARVAKGLWTGALEDAMNAIDLDPSSHWSYEAKYTALLGLKRYDEAVSAFGGMLSVIERSPEEEIRQLRKKYTSPSQVESAIDASVRATFKICPLVLIDVETGRLCNAPERIRIFKSDSSFKELVASMTTGLDHLRILQVVAKYFQYVTFSHVWQGLEPLFQDVSSAESIQNLALSDLNNKLRKFCELVREDGYRWAWSDTCCIDKTISTELNESLALMYKWDEESAATLVYLVDVEFPSVLGDLTKSIWMTRAWTLQELLAPKVIRFYDRKWKPYLGDKRTNHKESPEIMQELARAIRVPLETIIAFHPDGLSIREKLRLASTRNATREEDIAYSLIGIFKSDIKPNYGDREKALGQLLEEIVARWGDVTVLSWTGKSSPYNSCLPATLAVYSQTSYTSAPIEEGEMETRIAALRATLPEEQATMIHERITRMPPARFANRRLYLPCVVFPVRRLGIQAFGTDREKHYRVRLSAIGIVEIWTSDELSPQEPHRLIFVHPWLRSLCGLLDGVTWQRTSAMSTDDSDYDSGDETESSSPLDALLAPQMDAYTRALRLIVGLKQPFNALLLQQQPNGEFRRVAADHEIVLPGLGGQFTLNDIHVDVVEVL